MEHFDALVIGGGVIGTSIAYHLARFGAGRVLLLEPRAGSCRVRTRRASFALTTVSVKPRVARQRSTSSPTLRLLDDAMPRVASTGGL